MAVGNLLTSLRANTERARKMAKNCDKPSRKSHSTLKQRIRELATEKKRLAQEVQKLKNMQEEILNKKTTKTERKEKRKQEMKTVESCPKCGNTKIITVNLKYKTIKICTGCQYRLVKSTLTPPEGEEGSIENQKFAF